MCITIKINLDKIRKNDNGFSRSQWALGTIDYGRGESGHLLYIKSSLTGKENEYIKSYRKKDPTFPDQSTADQFFDETQFECYRALGEYIALEALNAKSVNAVMPG